MSKKDVNDYFRTVCSDYHDLIETLHEVEKYAETNIVSSDKLEEISNLVEVTKNNYLRISYIMYLLDKPVKKQKYKTYDKATKYDTSQTAEVIHLEDEQVINMIKSKLN